jgi:zinc protease
MLMAWHGPEFRKDSAATLYADLFSTALNLNSSKWKQSLIDKGLALFAGLNYTTNRYVGPIQIFVVPNPTKLKECYTEVMNQVAHFSDADYITDEQLKTAKEVLMRDQIRSTEKPSALASQLTVWWASTNYVNKYIKGKPYVAGMIINPEMNKQFKPGEYFKN